MWDGQTHGDVQYPPPTNKQPAHIAQLTPARLIPRSPFHLAYADTNSTTPVLVLTRDFLMFRNCFLFMALRVRPTRS